MGGFSRQETGERQGYACCEHSLTPMGALVATFISPRREGLQPELVVGYAFTFGGIARIRNHPILGQGKMIAVVHEWRCMRLNAPEGWMPGRIET